MAPKRAQFVDPTAMGRKQPPAPEPESDEDEEIEEGEEGSEDEFDIVEALNNLSLVERRRVYALKGIEREYLDIRRKFRDEAESIELELHAKRQGLFEARRAIVLGEREVTDEESKKGESEQASKVEVIESDSDDAKKQKKPAPKRKGVKVVAPSDAAPIAEIGIPDFWLNALKNNEVLEGMITERDEEVLHFLQDITMEYVEGKPSKGYILHFHFAPNSFFSEAKLTKTYLLSLDDYLEEELDKSVGCAITWSSPAKNVTVEIKQKKQRHKSGKGVRVVQREENVPSFFRFFSPPDPDKIPADGEDDEDEDIDEVLQGDYEAGSVLQSMVVPRAVWYYTGEACEQIAQSMHLDFGGEDGDDEEGEEEEEESEEEEPPAKRGGRAGGAQPAPKRGGGRGRGGPAGAGANPPPECKAQ